MEYSESKNIQINGETGLKYTLSIPHDWGKNRPQWTDGHFAVIKLLLDQNITKIDFNTRGCGSSSDTPILSACRSGDLDLVKLFLDYADTKNIDLNAVGGRLHDKESPFLYACGRGKEELFKLFWNYSGKSPIDWNAKDESGMTAFMGACNSESKFIVTTLMEHSESRRIDLNATDEIGTAFHYLCYGPHLKFLEWFLDNAKGIDWNAKKNGDTGLMRACRTGFRDTVKLLLEYAESKGMEIPEAGDFDIHMGGRVFNALEQPTIDLLEKYKKRKKRQKCNIFKRSK